MSKKSGFVPSTFTDAGTGETFEGGRDHSVEAGAHANYSAAGLIGAPTPRPARTSKKAISAKRPTRAPKSAAAPPIDDAATV